MRFLFRYTIIRYIVSGSTAALVYFIFLFLLTELAHIWYLSSSIISFGFAFVVSFVLQKFWTFKDSRMHMISRQLVAYLAVGAIVLALNTFFLYFLVDILGMWYFLASFLSSGVLAIFSFSVYIRFVFKKDMPRTRERNTQEVGNLSERRKTNASVLIATGLYPPQIGGPATYAKTLHDELPKHGVDVRVVSFGDVIQLPFGVRHMKYFMNIFKEEMDADIIFALDPVSTGLPALLSARILQKKFLLKVVGDYAWEQYQQKYQVSSINDKVSIEEFQIRKFDFFTEMRRRVQKYVATRADTIIVPSTYLKKIVKAWGVPAGKVVVIHNAYKLGSVSQNRSTLREKFSLKGTVLVSVGRLVPWKGFSTLLALMPQFAKHIPDVSLHIIGDGPELYTLKQKAYNLGLVHLREKIHFIGKLPHDTLLRYIKASDVFILNTRYEGLSHVLIEAMSVGVPIVTTRVGGNPELIEDGNTGFLVEYDDKKGIQEAVSRALDRNVAGRIVRNAQKKAKEFSKEKMLTDIVALLKRV